MNHDGDNKSQLLIVDILNYMMTIGNLLLKNDDDDDGYDDADD